MLTCIIAYCVGFCRLASRNLQISITPCVLHILTLQTTGFSKDDLTAQRQLKGSQSVGFIHCISSMSLVCPFIRPRNWQTWTVIDIAMQFASVETPKTPALTLRLQSHQMWRCRCSTSHTFSVRPPVVQLWQLAMHPAMTFHHLKLSSPQLVWWHSLHHTAAANHVSMRSGNTTQQTTGLDCYVNVLLC